MSGALRVIAPIATLGLVLSDLVILRPFRAIGPVIPDCTIEEHGSDRLVITEHPVEQGASISDHAYKLPAEVTLRYGFSNSTPQASFLPSVLNAPNIIGGGSENHVREIYEQLLKLQIDRVPFDILTGKRTYENMLIASLDQTTDSTSEHTLMVTIACKEVIIVSTQSTTVPAIAESQAGNTSPTNTGTKTPDPVSAPRDSVLKQGWSLL
jgi:hypothetical protein